MLPCWRSRPATISRPPRTETPAAPHRQAPVKLQSPDPRLGPMIDTSLDSGQSSIALLSRDMEVAFEGQESTSSLAYRLPSISLTASSAKLHTMLYSSAGRRLAIAFTTVLQSMYTCHASRHARGVGDSHAVGRKTHRSPRQCPFDAMSGKEA